MFAKKNTERSDKKKKNKHKRKSTFDVGRVQTEVKRASSRPQKSIMVL